MSEARGADLVVRAPNHLGDLVMSLPALQHVPAADVVVTAWLAPLLRLARGGEGAVIPLPRGTRELARASRAVRRRGRRRGVLLTPSFSSALLFALGGVRWRRGTDTDARRWLLDEAPDPRLYRGVHRSAMYWELLTGELPAQTPVPRLPLPAGARTRWEALVPAGADVGLFPGSNAPARRWDTDRFAAVARQLAGQGLRVVVFGGPGERALTAETAGDWALDLGGRTDLAQLAAGLAACRVVVTNDSGPMHLAAAVGARTVSLLGAADPVATRALSPRDRILRRADLPCVPCLKNHCPRTGAGYYLAEAARECLRLIPPDDVLHAVLEQLDQSHALEGT